MFKWFNKKETICKKKGNYEINEDGDISIMLKERSRYGYMHLTQITIPKSSIISYCENSIVSKNYVSFYNYLFDSCIINYPDYTMSIENKAPIIKYKETEIKTYKYSLEEKVWETEAIDKIKKEKVLEKSPLEVFIEESKSKYKLIESEDEFNEYLTSTLDCDTWCRKKLYGKMKELELGDGFINQFADLIGNDLDKYHAMIDLANEVSDKDTLMYLYTYKFSR